MPKGGFQLQVCKLTKWKKQSSQGKYTQFHWYGEIAICIGCCETTRSTSLQCETVSIPLPSAVPGAWQGHQWQGWDRGWVCYPQVPREHLPSRIHSGATGVLYEKPLQRCQDTGFAGHASIWGKRGKLSSPYSCFGEHQRCFYHSYESMIHGPFQFGLTFLKLLWNCSSLGSSAKFAVVMQECQ